MVRPEYSNYRDLSYSKWHRTLLSKCCTMNLDWVEYRFKNNKPSIVALIEDKDNRSNIREWLDKKSKIFLDIANSLNVPAYLVLHNCCMRDDHKELWRFKVINLKTNEVKIMNEKQYREFIEKLGD